MQSRKHSHYEIITNQILGICIGWSIVYFIFPMMGLHPSKTDASISSLLFFIASYVRMYIIRRIFNKKAKNAN